MTASLSSGRPPRPPEQVYRVLPGYRVLHGIVFTEQAPEPSNLYVPPASSLLPGYRVLRGIVLAEPAA